MPSHTAARPGTTLAATQAAAHPASPRRSSSIVSRPDAENVVKPPGSPVTSSRRAGPSSDGIASAKAAKTPISRQPTTFHRQRADRDARLRHERRQPAAHRVARDRAGEAARADEQQLAHLSPWARTRSPAPPS